MTSKPLDYLGEKHRMPDAHCNNCGALLSGASGYNTNEMPTPGMWALCIYCGNLAVYADDMTLRELSDAELLEAAGDPDIIKMQRVREALGKVYPPKGKQET